MRSVIRFAVVLAVIVLLLATAVPVLAAPPGGKVECIVEPVTGGPNNPDTHATPASVSIPSNNPAIRWNPADVVPGKVFVPPEDGGF